MEDTLGHSGPYVATRLADRLVPVPRDSDPSVSLYALCRAWVRNNPNLPLTLQANPSTQRDDRDLSGAPASAAPGSLSRAAGVDGALASAGASGADAGQAQGQEDRQASGQAQSREPDLPPQPQHLPQPDGGLLSILPPLLPPTALETDTSAPTYPLDDFEPQEPEESQRKLKDHWVAVRQYHQAVCRAKRSRCKERLAVLLGEPSSLQPIPLGPPQQLPLLPHQLPPHLLAGAVNAPTALQAALLQQQQQALAAGLMGQAPLAGQPGVNGLGPLPVGLSGFPAFPGGLLLPGQVGLSGGPPSAPQEGAAGGPSGGVNAAEAQAALQVLASLGQVAMLPTGALDVGAQQQQPQPHLQPPSGQLGHPATQLHQPQAHGQAGTSGDGGPDGGAQQHQEHLGVLLVNGTSSAPPAPAEELMPLPQPQQSHMLHQGEQASVKQTEDQIQVGQLLEHLAAGQLAPGTRSDGSGLGAGVGLALPVPALPEHPEAAAALAVLGPGAAATAGAGAAENGVEGMDVDAVAAGGEGRG